MRPNLGTKWNSVYVSHNVKSVWKSPAVYRTDTTQRGIIRLRLGFVALPAVPSAPHPHAVQTVGATAGLEANKAKRNGAPVPCSAAAGCGGQHEKHGADHWQDTDWILMPVVTARLKAKIKPSPLVQISCICSNTNTSICTSSKLLVFYKSTFHIILIRVPCCLIKRGVQKAKGYSLPQTCYWK